MLIRHSFVACIQAAEHEARLQRVSQQKDSRDVEIAKQKDVISSQASTIADLHSLVAQHQELIASQKVALEELQQRCSGRGEAIDTQRKEVQYLTQFRDKQADVIAKQREELNLLGSQLDEVKGKAARAMDLEDDVRDRLRVSESKRNNVEKKLIRLATELRTKHPLTYVPLCRTCRKYRMQNESLRRKIAALQERVSARSFTAEEQDQFIASARAGTGHGSSSSRKRSPRKELELLL